MWNKYKKSAKNIKWDIGTCIENVQTVLSMAM